MKKTPDDLPLKYRLLASLAGAMAGILISAVTFLFVACVFDLVVHVIDVRY
jgi:hypothetical protein